MKAIDFLQCSDCIDSLNHFMEKNEIEIGSPDGDLLAQFTLFLEIKKLRSDKLKLISAPINPLINPLTTNPVIPQWPNTDIIC